MKVAHLAEMYHVILGTGSAFPWQSAHLIAGVPNGWMPEYQLMIDQTSKTIFVGAPKPEEDRFPLLEKPGLGMELDEAGSKKEMWG